MEETGNKSLPVFLGEKFKFKPGETPQFIDGDPTLVDPVDSTITLVLGSDPNEGEIIAVHVKDVDQAEMLVRAYISAKSVSDFYECVLLICQHSAIDGMEIIGTIRSRWLR